MTELGLGEGLQTWGQALPADCGSHRGVHLWGRAREAMRYQWLLSQGWVAEGWDLGLGSLGVWERLPKVVSKISGANHLRTQEERVHPLGTAGEAVRVSGEKGRESPGQ